MIGTSVMKKLNERCRTSLVYSTLIKLQLGLTPPKWKLIFLANFQELLEWTKKGTEQSFFTLYLNVENTQVALTLHKFHTQKFLLDFSLLNKLSLTCKSVYFHVPDCKKWGGVKGYLRYKVIFCHKVVLDV